MSKVEKVMSLEQCGDDSDRGNVCLRATMATTTLMRVELDI